jgi:hypothetical protein
MLQRLSQHIAECYERAADCKRRAEHTSDPARKTELLDFERTWAHLARSYEFVESLEQFLLTARNHPNREPPHDPTSPNQSRTAQAPEMP